MELRCQQSYSNRCRIYLTDYYKYYTNGNYWTNPVNYDLTLNSGRLGQEKCVEMIKSALKIKLGVEV